MNKKIFMLAALSSLASVEITAHVLSFVEKDFDTFVDRMVPTPQRNKFKSYHKEVEKRLTARSNAEQEKFRVSFYERAKKSLRAEHRTWADDINAFLADAKYLEKKYDTERSDVKQFLYWCGTYDSFQVATRTKGVREQGRDRLGFVDNMKNQATKVADKVKNQASKLAGKVGDWFKTVKTRLT